MPFFVDGVQCQDLVLFRWKLPLPVWLSSKLPLTVAASFMLIAASDLCSAQSAKLLHHRDTFVLLLCLAGPSIFWIRIALHVNRQSLKCTRFYFLPEVERVQCTPHRVQNIAGCIWGGDNGSRQRPHSVPSVPHTCKQGQRRPNRQTPRCTPACSWCICICIWHLLSSLTSSRRYHHVDVFIIVFLS